MTLEELKKEIRPLDETSMEQARKHWIKIAKPLFSLGKLEDAVIQMAGIKETPDYELKKKALVIMCADNGIVEEGGHTDRAGSDCHGSGQFPQNPVPASVR